APGPSEDADPPPDPVTGEDKVTLHEGKGPGGVETFVIETITNDRPLNGPAPVDSNPAEAFARTGPKANKKAKVVYPSTTVRETKAPVKRPTKYDSKTAAYVGDPKDEKATPASATVPASEPVEQVPSVVRGSVSRVNPDSRTVEVRVDPADLKVGDR